jgi:hypothetical protein
MKDEPAFPGGGHTTHNGMTLRDWFAGQALAGLLGKSMGVNPRSVADIAYLIADAMLKRRCENEAMPTSDQLGAANALEDMKPSAELSRGDITGHSAS